LQSFKTKSAIIAVSKQRCKHGRPYLDHRRCYGAEHLEVVASPERVSYWDLETTNLSGDMGRLLTWCILDGITGKIYSDYNYRA
jgi:hypothetical protein